MNENLSKKVLLKLLNDSKYSTLVPDQLSKLIDDIVAGSKRNGNPYKTAGFLREEQQE